MVHTPNLPRKLPSKQDTHSIIITLNSFRHCNQLVSGTKWREKPAPGREERRSAIAVIPSNKFRQHSEVSAPLGLKCKHLFTEERTRQNKVYFKSNSVRIPISLWGRPASPFGNTNNGDSVNPSAGKKWKYRLVARPRQHNGVTRWIFMVEFVTRVIIMFLFHFLALKWIWFTNATSKSCILLCVAWSVCLNSMLLMLFFSSSFLPLSSTFSFVFLTIPLGIATHSSSWYFKATSSSWYNERLLLSISSHYLFSYLPPNIHIMLLKLISHFPLFLLSLNIQLVSSIFMYLCLSLYFPSLISL